MVNGRYLHEDTQVSPAVQRRNQRASGRRLRALLGELGISPMAFSEFVGISPQCLTNWFARGLPRQRLDEMARLLSVSPVWLAMGVGERHLVPPRRGQPYT